ncbi:MAG: D-glycero-alpha-D-manno-heptose-1,7-bisphosphate 7-phosphatase [Flavobacteriales bacterium]
MKTTWKTIDTSWTLFLDRDGVLNTRLIGDYVKTVDEFEWIDGVLEALNGLSAFFGRLIIVTNQQGIGKGLMTEHKLRLVHSKLIQDSKNHNVTIDSIYHAPQLVSEQSAFRKPNIGMAHQAKLDFPDINFEKSVMVGDSISDLEFGWNANMNTLIHISDSSDESPFEAIKYSSLFEFYQALKTAQNSEDSASEK